MLLLGIAGSLRARSYNRRLLDAASAGLPAGVELDVFDGLHDIPPYNADTDLDPAPPAVARLREAIAGADALLVATPEYNASVPGHLKNALDWASRPFPDSALRTRPAAVIGASVSPRGAVWAQADLRKALTIAGARVLDRELPVGRADEAFGDDGLLADPDLQASLDSLVAALLEEVRAGDGAAVQ